MRKVMIVMMLALAAINGKCKATDITGESLLALANLTKDNVTLDEVSSLLGKPSGVEENKKKTWWHYTKGTSTMTICWNKKSEAVERVSFNMQMAQKSIFDATVSNKLKSGVTNIAQALKLLGTPNDMTIKGSTQEIHYTYQHNVLRLFFRDRTLVDYCLY